MPTLGRPAAMTALPQPPNVSQNVPIASAEYFFIVIDRPSSTKSPRLALNCDTARGLRQADIETGNSTCECPLLEWNRQEPNEGAKGDVQKGGCSKTPSAKLILRTAAVSTHVTAQQWRVV